MTLLTSLLHAGTWRLRRQGSLPTVQGRVVHAWWLSCMERLWLDFWRQFRNSSHHDFFSLTFFLLLMLLNLMHLPLYLARHITLASKQQATAHRVVSRCSCVAYDIAPFCSLVRCVPTENVSVHRCTKSIIVLPTRNTRNYKKKSVTTVKQCTNENNIGTTTTLSAITLQDTQMRTCDLNFLTLNKFTTNKLHLKQSHYSPGHALTALRGWGSQISRQRHMKVVRLSALRTGHLYRPGNIPGTHFC